MFHKHSKNRKLPKPGFLPTVFEFLAYEVIFEVGMLPIEEELVLSQTKEFISEDQPVSAASHLPKKKIEKFI